MKPYWELGPSSVTENNKKRYYNSISTNQRKWFVYKRRLAAGLHKLAYNLGLVTYPLNEVRYSKSKYGGDYWSIIYYDPDNFGMRTYKTIFNRDEATKFVVARSKRPLLYRLRKRLLGR